MCSASDDELKERLAAEQRAVPFLIYHDASGKQNIYTLDGTISRSVLIGRESTTGLLLDWDPEVSRIHAELERIGEGWALVDDGLSSNGSYVNGELVNGRHRLQDGDNLQFGDTTVLYRAPVDHKSRLSAISDSRPRAGVLNEKRTIGPSLTRDRSFG